jgi:hypothetical protein
MWGSTKVFDKVDHQLLAKFPAISEDPNQRTKRGKTSLRSIYYSAFKPNNPITIITWNVNSLRKQYTHVVGLLTIDKPTILFLQLTKLEDAEMAKLSFDPQYFIAYTGTKQLNGVAIFSTFPFVGPTLTQIPGCTESSHRFIQVHIDGYILINVYIHQS